MDNAKAVFVDWYSSLPKEHQTDIGAFIVVALDPDGLGAEPPPAKLLKFIDSVKSPMNELGLIGAIRTIVTVCFAKPRARPEYWAAGATLNTILGARQRAAGDENFADKLSELSRDIPERKAQWKHTCESWERLIEGPLSDAALEAWFDGAMHRQITR